MDYIRQPLPYPFLDPYGVNTGRGKWVLIVILTLIILTLTLIKFVDKKISLKNFFLLA